MRRSKRTVKRLDTKSGRILTEPRGAHKRDCTESTHIGVVQSSAVVELHFHRRVAELRRVEFPVFDQKRASKSWLYDEAVAVVEIQNDQLGSPPTPHYAGITQSPGEGAGGDLAQYVRFFYRDFFYLPTANSSVEIAGDRL